VAEGCGRGGGDEAGGGEDGDEAVAEGAGGKAMARPEEATTRITRRGEEAAARTGMRR
jgi:hypothetical protein